MHAEMIIRFVPVWLVLMAAPVSFAANSALADAPLSYPEHIYPRSPSQGPSVSEIPFVESAESRQYGYDVPFPSVARTVANVEDFGARADGRTDCTMAFCRALTTVTDAARPGEILFPSKGRYFFRPNTNAGSDTLAILNVRHATNLLIRGQGHDTSLVMGDPALGGLNIVESDTVMVRDFAIDSKMREPQGGEERHAGVFDEAIAILVGGKHLAAPSGKCVVVGPRPVEVTGAVDAEPPCVARSSRRAPRPCPNHLPPSSPVGNCRLENVSLSSWCAHGW